MYKTIDNKSRSKILNFIKNFRKIYYFIVTRNKRFCHHATSERFWKLLEIWHVISDSVIPLKYYKSIMLKRLQTQRYTSENGQVSLGGILVVAKTSLILSFIGP